MREPRVRPLPRRPGRRGGSARAGFGLLAGLAVVASPFLGLAPAYACSCAAASEKQHLADADVVFKGTLIKRVAPPARDGIRSSMDPVTYIFDVTRSYKGSTSDPQRVRSAMSGASCGIELSGKGPYLVFASEPAGSKKNRPLQASLCGGTRPIGAKEEPAFAKKPAAKPAPKPAADPAAEPPRNPSAPTADPDGEPLPAAPGAPVVPVVPVDPVAPAERDALRAINSVAVGAQDFANRLVGPLFPQ
jgi:hypothetical protein